MSGINMPKLGPGEYPAGTDDMPAQRCLDYKAGYRDGRREPAVTITVSTPDGGERASWQRDAQGRLVDGDLIARAFEIADLGMFELLQSECVPQDDNRTTLGLVDDSCSEVSKLADASDTIREAVEWLAPRGYIQLSSDASGEYIDVLRRPGEE